MREPPPQPTAAPPEPAQVNAAGFLRRTAAQLLDLPLLAVLHAGFASAFGLIRWDAWPERRWNAFDHLVDVVSSQAPALPALAALGAALLFTYGLLTELLLGGTLGKRALRLTVIDTYGRQAGPIRLAIRNAVKVLSIATLLIGVLWQIVSRERRAAHDLASGTLVIVGRPPEQRHPRQRRRQRRAPAPPHSVPRGEAAWER